MREGVVAGDRIYTNNLSSLELMYIIPPDIMFKTEGSSKQIPLYAIPKKYYPNRNLTSTTYSTPYGMIKHHISCLSISNKSTNANSIQTIKSFRYTTLQRSHTTPRRTRRTTAEPKQTPPRQIQLGTRKTTSKDKMATATTSGNTTPGIGTSNIEEASKIDKTTT